MNRMATPTEKFVNRGSWTADEDRKLAQSVEIHGPRRWRSISVKAGLNRCGKSCRLRWLNYLRPDITRGNMSDAEDDLILRLHRLLGNRWSLIARRLPGRTDNEIKNYWNSQLSKKAKLMEKLPTTSLAVKLQMDQVRCNQRLETDKSGEAGDNSDADYDYDYESFDFSKRWTNGLEWVKISLEDEHD